jgi:hypothetical protein
VPGINQTGYRKLKQSFPGGTEASPRTGKLFGQGRQESCTNNERKRTALEQKGKLAYLAGPRSGDEKEFLNPRSGHDITIFLRKFLTGGVADGGHAITDASCQSYRQIKSAVLGRATGTVEHHNANAKGETASSPEQSVVE